MGTDEPAGDDVYQPEDTEVPADEGVLEHSDTLSDREADPYEEGWSPPEKPLGVGHRGTTANEQRERAPLAERLAEEVPDPLLDGDLSQDGDGIGDATDTDGEPWDGEVGRVRSGRLVALDEGAHTAVDGDVFARDVGVDGAAASAEEAAVHTVPDTEE
ncbi:DUF5709 domain-containing protein [Streptomyces sp. NPDC059740]|uniref:DUF5709 domain-containing protein n=1 Tax=Streptomyces sp. NPDC059740 TaxID=3346926 RepID=UPI003667C48E